MAFPINFHKTTIHNSQKILIIVSRYNTEITQKLCDGTQKRLIELGVNFSDIDVIHVPGAVEISVVADVMAKKKLHAAIICLGAIVRGETSHYDLVCDQVSKGCQKVSLATNIPLVFGVLTTDNEAQAYDRLGGIHGHKGHEFAECAIEMIQVLQACETL